MGYTIKARNCLLMEITNQQEIDYFDGKIGDIIFQKYNLKYSASSESGSSIMYIKKFTAQQQQSYRSFKRDEVNQEDFMQDQIQSNNFNHEFIYHEINNHHYTQTDETNNRIYNMNNIQWIFRI